MEVLCVAAVMIFARVAAPRVLRIAIAFRGSMISAEWLNGEGKRKKVGDGWLWGKKIKVLKGIKKVKGLYLLFFFSHFPHHNSSHSSFPH